MKTDRENSEESPSPLDRRYPGMTSGQPATKKEESIWLGNPGDSEVYDPTPGKNGTSGVL